MINVGDLPEWLAEDRSESAELAEAIWAASQLELRIRGRMTSELDLALRGNLIRAVRLAYAIQRIGCCREAMLQVRALVETWITVKFIGLDEEQREKRARAFCDFLLIAWTRNLEMAPEDLLNEDEKLRLKLRGKLRDAHAERFRARRTCPECKQSVKANWDWDARTGSTYARLQDVTKREQSTLEPQKALSIIYALYQDGSTDMHGDSLAIARLINQSDGTPKPAPIFPAALPTVAWVLLDIASLVSELAGVQPEEVPELTAAVTSAQSALGDEYSGEARPSLEDLHRETTGTELGIETDRRYLSHPANARLVAVSAFGYDYLYLEPSETPGEARGRLVGQSPPNNDLAREFLLGRDPDGIQAVPAGDDEADGGTSDG